MLGLRAHSPISAHLGGPGQASGLLLETRSPAPENLLAPPREPCGDGQGAHRVSGAVLSARSASFSLCNESAALCRGAAALPGGMLSVLTCHFLRLREVK